MSFIQLQLIKFFFFHPRFEECYVHKLPQFVSGNEFIENYGHHDDPVTVIDRKLSYAVGAPTRHPIYENFRVKVSELYGMRFLYMNNNEKLLSFQYCFCIAYLNSIESQ